MGYAMSIVLTLAFVLVGCFGDNSTHWYDGMSEEQIRQLCTVPGGYSPIDAPVRLRDVQENVVVTIKIVHDGFVIAEYTNGLVIEYEPCQTFSAEGLGFYIDDSGGLYINSENLVDPNSEQSG